MLDVKKIRKDFPILRRRINGKPLVYLDSAATSQKPKQVIEAEKRFYENSNANVRRSVHKLSEEATLLYENARQTVADFIGGDKNGVVFTKGATEAINIVANSGILAKGDEVIVTLLEHHSNIVPWLALKEKGVVVKFVDIDSDGHLRSEQFLDLVNEKTKLVSVAHVSNSLGTINNINLIRQEVFDKFAGRCDPYFLIDAAQSVGHLPFNISYDECGCSFDFVVFSGHKMFGPTGIGVLYVSNVTDGSGFSLRRDMQPLIKGGDMIRSVTLDKAEYAEFPQNFEGGTPNIAGAIGLSEAIKYIQKIGIEKIRKHDKELIGCALKKLSKIDGITIYGPKNSLVRSGSISFNIEGIHSHDVAQILSDEGIMIRSGHLCTQPLMKKLGINDLCRASFHIYNDKKDIDALVRGLEKVKKIFKK